MSSDRFRGGESRWNRGDFDRQQGRYDDRGERYTGGQEGRRDSTYREPFEQDRWGQGEGRWGQGPSYGSSGSWRSEGRGYSEGQADGEPYERGQGRYGQGSRPYEQYGRSQSYTEPGRSWEGDSREGRSYGSGRAEYSGGSPSQSGRGAFGSQRSGYGEEAWRPSDQFDGFDRSSGGSLESGPGRYGFSESGQGRPGSPSGSGSFGPGSPLTRGQGGRMGSGFSDGSGASYGQRMGAGSRQGRFTGKGPKGYQRSDERIKEDVSEALERDGDLDASEIEVTVARGEVTLEGTVPDRQSKRLAEDLVEDLSGVKQVHNRLRIGNGQESQKETFGSAGKSGSSSGTGAKTSGRSSI